MTESQTDTKQPPDRPRRRVWTKRLAIAAVVGLVLYTLGGFFLVPWIATSVAPPRISKQLNGQLTVGKARFNPFSLRLVLEAVEVTDAAGRRVAGFDQFIGNFDPLASIFRAGWRFHRIHLLKPDVFVEVGPDGALNLAALPVPPAEPAPASEPLRKIPRIVVRNIGFDDASLHFSDLSLPEPFGLEIADVDFTLDSLDTAPDIDNPINVVAQTASGATLRWQGSLRANPLSSSGVITLEGLNIPIFMPYALPYTEVRLREGVVGATLSYSFDPANAPRVAQVTLDELLVNGLDVEHADEPYLLLTSLAVRGVSADADSRTLRVESVTIDAPEVFAVREPGGDFRLTRILKEREAALRQAEQTSRQAPDAIDLVDPTTIEFPVQRLIAAIALLISDIAGPWDTNVQSVTLNGGAIHFSDRSLSPALETLLSDLTLTAGPIASAERFAAPFFLDFNTPSDGSVHVEGLARPLDQDAELAVAVDNIDLAPLGRYAPDRPTDLLPPIALTSATATVEGAVKAGRSPDGAIRAEWKGRVALTDVSVSAESQDADLVAWTSLAVDGTAGLTRTASGDLDAAWEGVTTLESLAIDAPLQGGVSASLASLTHDGAAGAVIRADESPIVTLAGDASITDFAGAAPQIEQAAASLAQLDVTALNFNSREMSVAIEQIALDAPNLSANTTLVPPPSSQAEGADEPAPHETIEAEPFALPFTASIGEFRLTNGAIDVRDDHVDPPARIAADNLVVNASSLATDGATMAEIDVATRVQGSGQLRVAGTVLPIDPRRHTDVQITLDGMPLDPYDPFSARFVGFLIDRGRMSMTLPVKIEDGQLNGDLRVNLDRFYLGERVENPDAPNVPVKLGLNLLRDANEQIDVRIPITGDTTKPGFRLGPIIWKAFFGLITNAATAPFKALASIFGGDSDADLSVVAFEPGDSRLSPAEAAKLDTLVRALQSRPGLLLRVLPQRAPEADRLALQLALLREQMLAEAQERRASITSLTDEQYAERIVKAYVDAFGSASTPPPDVIPGAPPLESTRPPRRRPWDRDEYIVPGRAQSSPPPAQESQPEGDAAPQPAAAPDDAPAIPFDVMERALAKRIEVDSARFDELALARAAAVADMLTGEGAIDRARVTIAGEVKDNETPVVTLELDSQ